MRYARLIHDYALRGFQDLPYVLIDQKTGYAEVLDKHSFFLLELCNGKIDLDAVFLTGKQKDTIQEFHQKGKITFSREMCPVCRAQEYRKADNCYIQSIHWSITGRCNLKCRHCYMSAPDYKYKDLPTETCLDIIDQMEQAGVASVSITGGEPFVREDIWTLLQYISEKGIAVKQIYTNGMLLTEEILKRLKEMGISPQFVLSFDGIGGHDWLRGKNGAGRDTIRAIRMLKRQGLGVMLETAVYRKNIGTLLETYALLKELQIDYWKTSLIFPAGRWREQCSDTIKTDELYQAYLRLIAAYIADGAPFSLQLDGFFACRRQDVKSWFSPYIRGEIQTEGQELCCATCRIHPYLLPDGTLIPCATMTDSQVEQDMPSLKEITISQIYRDRENPFFKIANMKTAEVLDGNKECRVCRHKSRCRGGCRAMSLLENKGLHGHAQVLCTFFNGGYEILIKNTVEKAGKEGRK